MTVIDVDDECTWTADIRTRVICWAERYHGTTDTPTICRCDKRMKRAFANCCALSLLQADQLLAGHVFAQNEHQYREQQICLILSKRVLRHQRHGCEPLLATWGGEGIYAASGTQGLRARLLSIGTPTVIQVRIDLFSGGEHLFFSALHKTFVGVALGLDNAESDVFYRAAVPSEDIERFIQAGDAEFEAFGL